MTLHHFIGANIELPIGSFGRNPTYKPLSELKLKGISLDKHLKKNNGSKLVKVYETEEDANGIDVFDLDTGYEPIRNKITTPFVYEVQGYLHANNTSGQRKSIKSIFSYIDEHLLEGDFIEIYSCWDGHEEKEKDDSKDVVINLSTLQFGKHLKLKDINHLCETFFLEDKQYVLIKK
ncbi:hypothetical protein N781_04860 [Pontibacillus halophilus JSM 076056 = DSM 19796]|uniref:Uncharacterized protein n=1 Tax=Pontibacillus halophilus JSM 076056 = DSM 19796 TaxID=1385510 RepID=A0A0A5G2B1_9BACI|nr:hypothetical protein [Pontibacillus halophilus]KGX86174.1 hypothetical protein N781_04860 [Pontibacillus halophilus JSM 076056 = DSM 19796]